REDHNPYTGVFPTTVEIDHDLQLLADKAHSIRTYGSAEPGVREIPRLARRHGLKVLVGAWLDADLEKNQVEIDAAVAAANANSNVTGVIVGNEALFRQNVSVSQLV